MPLFLFHLYNSSAVIDDEGQHFADLDSAREHAIDGARDVMATDLTTKGEIHLGHRIEIEDEEANITVVPFRDAVTIHG